VENVAALLGRGLDRVLGDLATLGFDAEWHCIPASAVGAPHRRDRIWIVAYPQRSELRDEPRRWDGARWPSEAEPGDNGAPEPVADPNGPRLAIWPGTLREWAHAEFTGTGWWAVEPDVGRVASRVPSRVERLRSLGNALVPQIPEIIGRAILAAEEYKPIWPIGTHDRDFK
jgi:DNA (cytosine-5)-methyltransferase 1